MGLYMLRAKYSQEALQGMVAKPEDRTGAVRSLYEAAGMKLLHLWMLPTLEVVAIAEGDSIKNLSIGGLLASSGVVTEGSAIELMTFDQVADAMKRAGALASKYRQPGK